LRFTLICGAALMGLLTVVVFVERARQRRERAELSAGATFFELDGRKIRYRLRGEDKPGPTVVLLHGYSAAIEQWEVAQEGLSAIAPVLTYDRAGSALSDPMPVSDADAQAEELAGLSTLKGVKLPFVVVGFSSSALVARAFAHLHPELLGGLVFLDPTIPEQINGVTKQELYARRVLYERASLVAAAKTGLGIRLSAPFPATTPAQQRAERILKLTSHWWAAYVEGKSIGRSAEEAALLDWSKLKVPVVLLSVARPDSDDVEVRTRYRLYTQLAASSHAVFLNPPGWKHHQIPSPPFYPEIANAVGVALSRAPKDPALGSSTGSERGVEEITHSTHVLDR